MSTRSWRWRSSSCSRTCSLAGAARDRRRCSRYASNAARPSRERHVSWMKRCQPLAPPRLMPWSLQKLPVVLARLAIALLLLGRQLDVQPFGAILGEEIAGQLLDLAAIDDRADQSLPAGTPVRPAVRAWPSVPGGTAPGCRAPPPSTKGRADDGTRRRRAGRSDCPSGRGGCGRNRRSSRSAAGSRSGRRRSGRPAHRRRRAARRTTG